MAGVVEAADSGEFLAMPLDLVNARGAQIHRAEGGERHVECPAQQDLYRRDVAYDQDRLALLVMQQPVAGQLPRARTRSRGPCPGTIRRFSCNSSRT
jgi:hypothetical protein